MPDQLDTGSSVAHCPSGPMGLPVQQKRLMSPVGERGSTPRKASPQWMWGSVQDGGTSKLPTLTS